MLYLKEKGFGLNIFYSWQNMTMTKDWAEQKSYGKGIFIELWKHYEFRFIIRKETV